MQQVHGATINPKRITEARNARGYSATELADMLGVTRQTVYRYEQGLSVPISQIQDKLSKKLDFPLSFFYNYYDPDMPMGTTFFRSMRTAESRKRTMVDIRCNWAGRIYGLLMNYLNLPEFNIPKTDLILRSGEPTDDDIELCASSLRECWRVPSGPINNLINRSEYNGIMVFKADIRNEKVDACHKMIAGKPVVFVCRDKSSACRNRFSLAHEIGHMMMHGYISQEELADKRVLDRIENEANKFASALLLPRDDLINDVCSTNLDFLFMLKRKWRVSLAAIVYRCYDIGIFTDSQNLQLQKQISMNRWRKKEPLDDEISDEQPQSFKSAISLLFENNILSKRQFIDTFDLPISDIAQICNVSPDYFGEGESPVKITVIK